MKNFKNKIIDFINQIIEPLEYIEFLKEEKIFYVLSSEPKDEVIRQMYQLVSILRSNSISTEIMSIPLKEIKTGYRDKCLENYCKQRLLEGKKDLETCWTRNGLITHCLGSSFDNNLEEDQSKLEYLLKLNENPDNFESQSIYKAYLKNPRILDKMIVSPQGWVYFKADIPYIRKGVRSFSKYYLRKFLGYPKGKNIIKIVKSMEEKGWNSELAYKPLCGILGYSTKLQKHHVISGKHRIASLKYLSSQDIIPGSLEIKYPIIAYDWGDWAQFVAYPGSECDCSDI